MTERPTLVVGLMSGTSLDGMDAALVRFAGPTDATLLGYTSRPYTTAERDRLAAALVGGTARDFAHLHAQVATWAAEAVDTLLRDTHTPASALDGIGFHGQTLWHEPPHVTWQLGDPALLAERFGVRVVSDFRARDLAAGGQAAPLVPMADVLLFGDSAGPRVLLNVGGMANCTYVPRRAEEHGVIGFDTGPGMAVIDALARAVDPARPFDTDGAIAAAGRVDAPALSDLLADPWLAEPPPRSTGRERFGADFAAALAARVPGPDGVATAVAFTARTIADAITRWIPGEPAVLVSGGGRRHPVLMRELERLLPGRIGRFEEHFFDGDAKEAVAFALLAYLTLHGQPGNLPDVTGATGPRVLGAITPA